MIGCIQGTIELKQKESILVLTAGGVGYDVVLSKITLQEMHTGQPCFLYTYLKVSDSGMVLYGFDTVEHRDFFLLLLSVSGIGPKSALNVLSLGSTGDIQAAIARGDVAYLSAVQGMGKKTAERIVVELKSKVVSSGISGSNTQTGQGDMLAEVIDALIAMGYSKEEAKERVQSLITEGKTTTQLVKEALQG